MIAEREQSPGGTTAISCCGANPGMVSWFVKEALVNLAADLGVDAAEPAVGDSAGWAEYMRTIGVRGIHIAERDTQRTRLPKPIDTFWNTWSVDGFISEGLQPAELGWGPTRTGCPTMPAPSTTRRRRHLPRAAGGRDTGSHLVPVARSSSTASW